MNGEGERVKSVRWGLGWVGMYKVEWRTKWWVVLTKGKPSVFPTADAAKVAAWEAKHAEEQPVCYGLGRPSIMAKSAAAALFPGLE